MLVISKKSRINLKLEGQGAYKVIRLIKENFIDVEVRKNNNADDSISIKDTDWYKDVSKGLVPGKALKVYRNNANLTMLELSKKCGIAQSHLSDMKTGKRNIGKISAVKLANALSCNYRRFL